MWNGSALHCPNSHEIILLHSRFNNQNHGTRVICNDGDIVGSSVEVENNCYTSKLEVQLTTDLIGSTIECFRDDGVQEILVNSTVIAGKHTITL